MRAAVIDQLGSGPTFRQMARPIAGPGQALVRVLAAALNPVDLRLATGGHQGVVPSVPYIPGSEGVGIVVAGAADLKGKRVRFQAGGSSGGGLAEWVTVDAAACLLLPDKLPEVTAAGLGVAGMAAWIPLVDKVQLQRGERVLILGATGIVGQVAVQIAKLLGAGRIVAAGRDLQVLTHTLELGADAVVAISGQNADQLRDEFAAAARGPLDVVFDPVWGLPLEAALGAVGPSARIVNVGQSAGDEASLKSSIVRGRQLTIIGHTNPNTSWELRAQAFRELADHAVAGRIRFATEELPLSEIAKAWKRQAASPHVKLVLRPAP